jgi:hypothetical protein
MPTPPGQANTPYSSLLSPLPGIISDPDQVRQVYGKGINVRRFWPIGAVGSTGTTVTISSGTGGGTSGATGATGATGAPGTSNSFTVVEVSASFFAVISTIVLVTSTSGNLTGTLPLTASNANAEITVKKVSGDSNTVTLVGSGSNTIDGKSNLVILYKESSVTLVSDGISNWDII